MPSSTIHLFTSAHNPFDTSQCRSLCSTESISVLQNSQRLDVSIPIFKQFLITDISEESVMQRSELYVFEIGVFVFRVVMINQH